MLVQMPRVQATMNRCSRYLKTILWGNLSGYLILENVNFILDQSMHICFREKLMSQLTRSKDIIPQFILKKYILYARQYVHPKLTVKAAEVLQRYYLELRSRNVEFGGIPIYNRQLEAMIRLTEVRLIIHYV